MGNRGRFLIVTGLAVLLLLVVMVNVFRGDESGSDERGQSGSVVEDAEGDVTSDGSGSSIQIVESGGTITASEPDVVVSPPTEDEPALTGGNSLSR